MKLNESDYDKYLSIARDIQNTQDESWRYVEKRFYAIASGALALSITLLSTTAQDIHAKWLIVTSWIMLISSIIINLVSHIISYNGSNKTLKEIYIKIEQNKPFNDKDINTVINKHNHTISILNFASIISLILGTIGMVAFFIDQITKY